MNEGNASGSPEESTAVTGRPGMANGGSPDGFNARFTNEGTPITSQVGKSGPITINIDRGPAAQPETSGIARGRWPWITVAAIAVIGAIAVVINALPSQSTSYGRNPAPNPGVSAASTLSPGVAGLRTK